MEDTRIDRAIPIYEGADTWLRAVDVDGKLRAYLVPATGAPNRVWRTTADSCDCPDAEYRGVVCKHQWAVRLHEAASSERAVKRERVEARARARRAARTARAAEAGQFALPLDADAPATDPADIARIEGGRRIA